jgi:hypothetical protein
MTDSRKLICKTQHEIVVAYLWNRRERVTTHELQGVNTPYGHIGSASHTRVRELARNECADKLMNKVERAEGRDIGLDPLSLLEISTGPREAGDFLRASRTVMVMVTILFAVVSILVFRFHSRAVLELMLVALQHQLAVLRRQRPGRPQLSSMDRLL